MAELKPAYLISGDDDVKIDAWRTRLRRRAEAELGAGGLESFNARGDPPEEVAAALSVLTFATGTRYLLVDDAGAWKAPRLPPLLDALAAMPPDTVLLLVVRGKPLKGLEKAVKGAGGEVQSCAAPRPWEMGAWVAERAREEGLRLDTEAAKSLLGIVGASQQRLTRELEKIAIAVHPQATVTVEDVERFAAGETAPGVYALADALVAGNLELTIEMAEELTAREGKPAGLLYPIVTRVREVHRVLAMLDAGMGEKDMAGALGAPPWRVKKAVALARKADRESLERALCRFADLEQELRGGGPLDEDTAVTLALARAAA